MKTLTSFVIEQSDRISCSSVTSRLIAVISELGSARLKEIFSVNNISIDNGKCHYQVRNDALTIVFNDHLGNLIDEVARLIKISISEYSIEYYSNSHKEKDFFDWNKSINDICEKSGKEVFATNIEFNDIVTPLISNEHGF